MYANSDLTLKIYLLYQEIGKLSVNFWKAHIGQFRLHSLIDPSYQPLIPSRILQQDGSLNTCSQRSAMSITDINGVCPDPYPYNCCEQDQVPKTYHQTNGSWISIYLSTGIYLIMKNHWKIMTKGITERRGGLELDTPPSSSSSSSSPSAAASPQVVGILCINPIDTSPYTSREKSKSNTDISNLYIWNLVELQKQNHMWIFIWQSPN